MKHGEITASLLKVSQSNSTFVDSLDIKTNRGVFNNSGTIINKGKLLTLYPGEYVPSLPIICLSDGVSAESSFVLLKEKPKDTKYVMNSLYGDGTSQDS